MNKETFNPLKCPGCNHTFSSSLEFDKHPCMTPKCQRETVIKNLISLAALAVSIAVLIMTLLNMV